MEKTKRIMTKIIKMGGQFSGVGAFDYAIKRVGQSKNFIIQNIYQCELDKYARKSYLANHEMPEYYIEDVKNTPTKEITEKHGSLDIAMFSPPCQAFSVAGKQLGKKDKRGVLFFDSFSFIQENKPRFFIFENVRGLISNENGKTFQEWINLLGGKSVNGNPVIFPYHNSVPYHLYFKVLNSKKHGVPQNRERVFIIGIRDNVDNYFSWPKEEELKKKLKDILEVEVDKKYFLSDKMIEGLQKKGTLFEGRFSPLTGAENNANAVTCNAGNRVSDNFIKVVANTKKGYQIATENDSINFSFPGSKIRDGRVGKEVANTLDTQCNQGIFFVNGGFYYNFKIRKLTPRECFRLQDFPDSFDFVVSNSQLYKQAGNSITVRVLELITSKLKL